MIDLPDDWVPIFAAVAAGFFTLTAALIGAIFAWQKNRADRNVAERVTKAQIDAQIDARLSRELEGAYARIDALEQEQSAHAQQMGAVARILRTIAQQWPNEHSPLLDPTDIALIEDTIPVHWLRTRTKETS